MSMEELLVYLTPVIVLIATWVVGKLIPFVQGWMLIIIMAALSTGYALVMQLLSTPELPWFQQILYGLLAVFIHQLSKQFSPTKVIADNQKAIAYRADKKAAKAYKVKK